MFHTLMSSNSDECDRAVSRHVSPKDQRNIQDKLYQLKQKVSCRKATRLLYYRVSV